MMVHRKGANRVRFTYICTFLLWFLTCFKDTRSIKITKFVVPDIVQYGVQDTILMECDFTYKNTTGLVIKWFYGNNFRLVYQWIKSRKPQAVGLLRNRVDLDYKASDDPVTMYSAMKIVKVSTQLSGNYTCVVSSFFTEDSQKKEMIVFAPATDFRLMQNKSDDETVNVICTVEGVYPAPNLTIATPEKRLCDINHNIYYDETSDRYSAVASVTLRDADLPSPAEFICTLRITKAKYTLRKETIYYPGPISTTPEIPTAADMHLAAAIGSKGASAYTAVTVILLPAFAHVLTQ